jgi:uncharacterized membrane protein (UPF0182 family)
MRVYIARFERLFDDHTIFGGVTYTDAHVMLAGLLVVCVGLMLGAAIAAINAVSAPRMRWLVAAVVPAAVCYLAVQIIACVERRSGASGTGTKPGSANGLRQVCDRP